MGVKDLEVMMQNVITSAFETVTTVELGVQVLDVFQHLSSREVNLLPLEILILLTCQYKMLQFVVIISVMSE